MEKTRDSVTVVAKMRSVTAVVVRANFNGCLLSVGPVQDDEEGHPGEDYHQSENVGDDSGQCHVKALSPVLVTEEAYD